MYLLVFITLMVSMIGLYTQVAALQAARFASSQTTLASAMLAWHTTAVEQTNFAIDQTVTTPNFPAGGGCYLTLANPITASAYYPTITASAANLVACKDTAGKTVTVPGGTNDTGFIGVGTSTLTLCAKTTPTPLTPPCLFALPSAYQVNPYTFYSVVYKLVGPPIQMYVMTFVSPPTISSSNPSPGFIYLPPATTVLTSQEIGFSIGDLYHQLQVSKVPTLAYGTVVGGVVTTLANSGGTAASTIQYTLPAGWVVPNGSVALISSAGTPPCPSPLNFNQTTGVCS